MNGGIQRSQENQANVAKMMAVGYMGYSPADIMSDQSASCSV